VSKCWYCEKDIVFEGGELVKDCPHCGVENDINPYPPKKEEVMIPVPKNNNSQFAPWLSTKYIPEKGMELTITDEWAAPESSKVSSFVIGECEYLGEKFSQGINETSYREISKVYGKDTANWIGKKIVYQGKVKMGQRGAMGNLWTAKQ